MLNNEAIWIGNNLKLIPLDTTSIVLNFGSQNQKYNKGNKYLMDCVINPLKRKCQLRNLDIQSGIGIDYSGDLYDDDFFNKIKTIQFDCVLLCNVLEHVTNIESLANRISEIIKPEGFIVFSGPFLYPTHYDPIDNGFRPTVKQVESLFPDFSLLKGEIIKDFTYSHYVLSSIKLFLLTFLRVLMPFYKFKKWRIVVLPMFAYWKKNFQVTCIILQKKSN